MLVLAYYSDDDTAPDKTLTVELGAGRTYAVYRVDAAHNGEQTDTVTALQLTLSVNSCILIQEV